MHQKIPWTRFQRWKVDRGDFLAVKILHVTKSSSQLKMRFIVVEYLPERIFHQLKSPDDEMWFIVECLPMRIFCQWKSPDDKNYSWRYVFSNTKALLRIYHSPSNQLRQFPFNPTSWTRKSKKWSPNCVTGKCVSRRLFEDDSWVTW